MEYYDIVVIGSGPAGLAAALSAYQQGVSKIIIIERDRELGGILQQCIHNGFGLFYFKEELTGPEYAQRFIQKVKTARIEYRLNTMVINITPDKKVIAVNKQNGIFEIQAQAIILAMGCRERSRGAINIPGTRPAGIFTAGTTQRFVNMEGYLPGQEIVILGSGDIGLIMARRLTLEGAKVKAVLEILPYSSGLTRNIVQCLQDYNIPIFFNHTITLIHGKERVAGVTYTKVDRNREPIIGTDKELTCDTLLLSVGLIPENELSIKAGVKIHTVTGGPIVNEMMESSISGIFACGNVVHVHDLVDNVTGESELAGYNAANYVLFKLKNVSGGIKTIPGKGITYIVPQVIHTENIGEQLTLYLRVNGIYKNSKLNIKLGNQILRSLKKQIMVPGEMQIITLRKVELLTCENRNNLIIEVEEGGDPPHNE